MKYRNLINNLLLGALGILLIVLMVRFSGVSVQMIIESLVSIKYYYLVSILFVTFITVAFTSWKWELILKQLTSINTFAKGYFFYYTAIGLVSNYLVPHVGNYGLKTLSMKLLHNVPVKKGALSILIEQLFDLLVLMLIVVPALFFFLKILPLEAALGIVAGLFILSFLLLIFKYSLILGVLVGFYKAASRIVKRGSDLSALEKHPPINRDTALMAFGYSCLKQLCNVLRVYIVVLALGIKVPLSMIFLAGSLIQGVILIALIPGALGILEISWFGILALLGVSRVDIGVFVVVLRVLNETSLVLVAGFSYLYYLANRTMRGRVS
jgi:uncharacterized protein (TIRG00374 family)